KVDDFPKLNDPRAIIFSGFRTPLMWAAYHNDVRMVCLLLKRGADPNQSTYFGKQDCVSCHQQYLPMAAVGHARNRSVRFDQKVAREQIDSFAKLTNPAFEHENISQTLFNPDPAQGFGYHLFGFAAERVPPSAMTDGMIHHLVTVQASDGRWFNNLPRPPIQS